MYYKKKIFIGSCKHSDICTFSFPPFKNNYNWRGGLISTNNKKKYTKNQSYLDPMVYPKQINIGNMM